MFRVFFVVVAFVKIGPAGHNIRRFENNNTPLRVRAGPPKKMVEPRLILNTGSASSKKLQFP